ncbi:MAG: hypothetical protein Q9165_008866 [Trypethelium subeluteriae]
MQGADAVSDVGSGSPDAGHGIESAAKRRKIRKGTRSCWECKRRKVRCLFSTPSVPVCIGCQKRDTDCVSQEYSEETVVARSSREGQGRYIGNRIVRIEALVEQLAKKVRDGNNGSTAGAGSPALSEGGDPTSGLGNGVETSRSLTACEPPGYAHPELHAEAIRGLSEPPRQLMQRFADSARGLVINNDAFLGSVDGLECIMLEVMYQANGGNLRRAWFACRRAMVYAQMMGIHRSSTQHPLKVIDTSEPVYPNFIWYRIVCTDRQLSLMLGLPQGSLDVSMASEAALASDTPSGKFERKQTVVASRILERNESSNPAIMDDFAVLQELDIELQKAANEMPSKWWLVPNLAGAGHDPEKIVWEMLRLLDQVFYFNLLNLLHLPYMLRSSASNPERSVGVGAYGGYEYSKLTSVNAARELLTRFIMFRSFNRVAFCCRSVDFFALTAAMTLIIAHLDGHRRQRQRQQGSGIAAVNVLAHQRNSDRAMMEQVLENMEAVMRLNTDVLSERSSNLLKRLLVLEADAAATTTIDSHPHSTTDDAHFLRIDIPYFGNIRIGGDGVVSMAASSYATIPSPMPQLHVPSDIEMFSPEIQNSGGRHTAGQVDGCSDPGISTPIQPLFDEVGSEMLPVPRLPQRTMPASSSATQLPNLQRRRPSTPQLPSAINNALQQQYSYPGLTAGADEWAFQGVDMAFFDSLIRGSGVDNISDGSSGMSWDCVP